MGESWRINVDMFALLNTWGDVESFLLDYLFLIVF